MIFQKPKYDLNRMPEFTKQTNFIWLPLTYMHLLSNIISIFEFRMRILRKPNANQSESVYVRQDGTKQ